MVDEKDRLGEKLRDVEAARENQWARQHDAELLEEMRAKTKTSLRCPRCQKPLTAKKTNGIEFLACPADDGAWLEAEALKTLLKARK